jgi:hypothetical protein
MTEVKTATHIKASKTRKEVFSYKISRVQRQTKPLPCVRGLVTTVGYVRKEPLELTTGMLRFRTVIALILHEHLSTKEDSGLCVQSARAIKGEGSNKQQTGFF